MKVSIIMPVYNGEKYVNQAIESILNQTFRDLEFIIVDDGSTDKSLEIINEYSKNDDRIKLIRNLINIGMTKSLNKAIKLCQGDFIARQDVDDVSLPKRLEKQIKFLSENLDFAFCGCDGILRQNIKQDFVEIFEFDEIRKNLILENCFIHPSIVVRKEILEKYGYYNEKYYYGQDYELWCRLILKNKLKAKNLKEKLIIRNVPPNRFFKKNLRKFFIQRINTVKTQVKYVQYAQYKLQIFFSIFIRIIEIITLSHIMGFFFKYFKKFNF